VADAAAGVGEGLAFFGDELKVIALGLQGELEDAKGGIVANFAIRLGFAERAMILSARANNEFANATRGIRRSVRSLGSKTLVVVVVAVDDHVGVGVVKRIPKRLDFEIVAVGAAGTEQRLVPIGECTSDRMRGKISAKPLFLWRAGFTAADVFAFAVQNDDVPGAEIVAVVAGLWVARGSAKIIEIRRGCGRVKLMIAGRRARARLGAAPGFVITLEILFAAVWISKVARGEDRAGNLVEQFRGSFCAGGILAVGDVTGTYKNRGLLRRGSRTS